MLQTKPSHGTMGRRFALLCGLLLVAVASATPAPGINREQQVKAAYLYNFARFTTWPAAKLGAPRDPILFCALENDPVIPAIDEALQGKEIEGHPAVVVRAHDAGEMRRCHIAYLGGIAAADLASALGALSGSAVLTVHESDATLRAGIVRLFVDDHRLRFEINMAAAEREHVQLSSGLLSLARITRD